MAVFVLTWNPDKWAWPADEYERAVRTTVEGGRQPDRWSVGLRRGGVSVGDRAFLLRQRRERGLVASGQFRSTVEPGEHWDGSGRETTFAAVEWDTIVDPADRLPVAILNGVVPEVVWDRIQGSGVEVPADAAMKVERLWAEHTREIIVRLPDELPPSATFPEGGVARLEVNRYERDPRARAVCLARWGPLCAVCGIDFEASYGAIGKGFIHVHHLRELSGVGDDYRVDPVHDLRPVCPNCHAMLHQRQPALTIAELQAHMRREPIAP